jgi:imidazolonepropionase-like amidohydrolase
VKFAVPVSLLIVGLAGSVQAQDKRPIETNADRKPKLKTTGELLIRNARILTVTKGTIERGDILVRGGKIAAVGKVDAPAGLPVIDATGKVVAPGIVDAHVHRGADSTNEGTDAIVGEGRILDVLNPDAKNLWQAAASGETTALILHGSANPIGAQSLIVKVLPGYDPRKLPVPDAPRMIKFALGENVTRSGSTQGSRFPRTRMGVQAVYRRAFTQAKTYKKAWEDWWAKKPGATEPERDLRLETLVDILDRKIWVQCHSYRADEILMMVRLSQEFGFKIGAMQHGLEAYKVAPELAAAGVGASIFSDNWAGKLEMVDGIPYGPAILTKAGVLTSVNTDGTSGTAAINIEAAKTMRYGGLTEAEALRLITINPAKQLGIDHRVGSIEVGKDADLVVWNGHPLSVYAKVDTTIVEGQVTFQRRDAFGIDAASTVKPALDKTAPSLPASLPRVAPMYAIVNATIHPVSDPVIENGTIVVAKGVIQAIGTKVPVPRGASVIDGRGMHVYPGFIDGGTTLGLTEFGQVGQATDARELGNFQPDLVAATAVNIQSVHIPTARAGGVTTALTMPTGGTIAGHASLLNLSGWTVEQMTLLEKAGMIVSWPGGGGGNFGDQHEHRHDDLIDDNHDDLMGAVVQGGGGGSANANQLEEYIEKAAKYGRSRNEPDLSLEAMQPLFTKKLPVFIRVRNAASIRDAVKFIKDHKMKAVLLGAPDAWKEAKLLAESGIPVIIEPAGKALLGANTTVQDWDPYDTPYALPALLRKAGVKFCFMTNDFAESKDLPIRVGQSCAYGLKPADALRAITLSAAEIFGVEDRIGSLQKGKMGNLVVMTGDPFELTSQIRYVFIDGKPVSLETKQSRLRDQYMQRLK